MSVEGGNRFYWYETRCVADTIKPGGASSWSMRMSCEGEGEKFKAQPTLTLETPSKLVITSSPVGRAKRDVYIRCDPKTVPFYDEKTGKMKKGGR